VRSRIVETVRPAPSLYAEFYAQRPHASAGAPFDFTLRLLRPGAATVPREARRTPWSCLALPLGTPARPLTIEAADSEALRRYARSRARLLVPLLEAGVSAAAVSACRSAAATPDEAEAVLHKVMSEALFRRAELRKEGVDTDPDLCGALMGVVMRLRASGLDLNRHESNGRYPIQGAPHSLALALHDAEAFAVLAEPGTPGAATTPANVIYNLVSSPYHSTSGNAAARLLAPVVAGAFAEGKGSQKERAELLMDAMGERSVPCLVGVLDGTAHVDPAWRERDSEMLNIAAGMPWAEGISCLLERGLDVNTREAETFAIRQDMLCGNTPLHEAAGVGERQGVHETVASLEKRRREAKTVALKLLKAGASPRVQAVLVTEEVGPGRLIYRTPAGVALSQGNDDLAALLLAVEAQPAREPARDDARYAAAADAVEAALAGIARTDETTAHIALISPVLATLQNLLRADVQLAQSEVGLRLAESVGTGLKVTQRPDAPGVALWREHALAFLPKLREIVDASARLAMFARSVAPSGAQRESMEALLGETRRFCLAAPIWRLAAAVEYGDWTAAQTLWRVRQGNIDEDDLCTAYALALQHRAVTGKHTDAERMATTLLERIQTPRAARFAVEAAVLAHDPKALSAVLDHVTRNRIALADGQSAAAETVLHLLVEASPAPLPNVLKALSRVTDWGAMLGRADDDGDTPWHLAARRGDGALKVLLEATTVRDGATLRNAMGRTPIDEAIAAGSADDVHALLDVDAKALEHASLLGAFAEARGGIDQKVIDGLMAAKGGPKVLRRCGRDLMLRLARQGQTNSLKRIVRAVPEVIAYWKDGQENLLHAVARSGRLATLDMLRDVLKPVAVLEKIDAGALSTLAQFRDADGRRPDEVALIHSMGEALRRLRGVDASPVVAVDEEPVAEMQALADKVADATNASDREAAAQAFWQEASARTRPADSHQKVSARMRQAANTLAWQVIHAIATACDGAGMGLHFPAHDPTAETGSLASLRARIVEENNAGASLFGPDDGVALLRLRHQALQAAEVRQNGSSWGPGRLCLNLQDDALSGFGLVVRTPEQAPELFEGSQRVRCILRRTPLGPQFVTLYPIAN
jgi:hypothetical protein